MTAPRAVGAGDGDERLVFAVLAAQVVALCERVESGTTLDLIWRATDMLGLLAEVVRELAPCGEPGGTPLNPRHAAALAAAAEVRGVLEHAAFSFAQRHDLIRQIADGVVLALERLAAESGDAPGLSHTDLMALYVSEDQRKVHAAVLARSDGPADPPGGAPGTKRRQGKGPRP